MLRKLGVKIGIVLLAAAIVPLYVFLQTSYLELRDAMAAHVQNQLESTARILAGHLGGHLLSARNALQVISESRLIAEGCQTPAKEVEAELARLQLYTQIFDDLTLVNEGGVVQASTTYTYEGEWTGKAWFKDALKGKVAFGRAHLLLSPMRTVSVMCVPVAERLEKKRMVLCGRLPLQYTDPPPRRQNYSLVEILERSPLGQTGKAFLVNESGRTLAHHESDRIYELWRSEHVISRLMATGGGHAWERGPEGKFLAVVFIDDPSQLLSERWAVVTTLSEKEALAPLAGLLRGLQWSVLLALGLALLLAIVFSRRFTVPIRKLVKATDRLATGDLTARVQVTGEDEIAQLARHFNEMSSDLSGAMSRIRESEERYRALVETAGEGILALDQGGVVLHANPALEKMIGTMGVMGGVISSYITVIEPEGAGLDQLVVPPQPSQEMLWRTINGDEVWVLYAARRIDRLGPKEPTTFAVITDITERKKMERQLARYSQDLERMVEERTMQLADQSRRLADALTDLERTDKSKGEFISRMSHELRTPLNSIIGFAKMIKKEGGDNLSEQTLHDVNIIEENGEYLLRLLNDVLDVSKIQAGMLDLEIETVDAGRVAADAFEIAHGVLGDRSDLKLINRVPPEAVWVHADPLRLQQVITNLLGNAVKFTEKGSVSLDMRQEDGDWHFEVADTGAGIAPEELPFIFDEFRQAKNARRQGSGLGLALVRLLVEKMDGRVWAESEVNVGSRFHFTLPNAVPATFDIAETDDEAAATSDVILVIQTDEKEAAYLADLLRAEGCSEVEICTPEDALDAAIKVRPQAIVLDAFAENHDMFALLHRLHLEVELQRTGLMIASVDPSEGNGYAYAVDWVLGNDSGRRCVQRAHELSGKPIQRVLIVADRVEEAMRIGTFMREADIETVKAFTAADALELLENVHFDCCMIDLALADGTGLKLLHDVKAHGCRISIGLLPSQEMFDSLRKMLTEKSRRLRNEKILTGEMLSLTLGCKKSV